MQRPTSTVTEFSLSSTLAGAVFPPIFTKFGTLYSRCYDCLLPGGNHDAKPVHEGLPVAY